MPEGNMSGCYSYDYNVQLGQNAHRGNSPRCASDFAEGPRRPANPTDDAEQRNTFFWALRAIHTLTRPRGPTKVRYCYDQNHYLCNSERIRSVTVKIASSYLVN